MRYVYIYIYILGHRQYVSEAELLPVLRHNTMFRKHVSDILCLDGSNVFDNNR